MTTTDEAPALLALATLAGSVVTATIFTDGKTMWRLCTIATP